MHRTGMKPATFFSSLHSTHPPPALTTHHSPHTPSSNHPLFSRPRVAFCPGLPYVILPPSTAPASNRHHDEIISLRRSSRHLYRRYVKRAPSSLLIHFAPRLCRAPCGCLPSCRHLSIARLNTHITNPTPPPFFLPLTSPNSPPPQQVERRTKKMAANSSRQRGHPTIESKHICHSSTQGHLPCRSRSSHSGVENTASRTDLTSSI